MDSSLRWKRIGGENGYRIVVCKPWLNKTGAFFCLPPIQLYIVYIVYCIYTTVYYYYYYYYYTVSKNLLISINRFSFSSFAEPLLCLKLYSPTVQHWFALLLLMDLTAKSHWKFWSSCAWSHLLCISFEPWEAPFVSIQSLEYVL